MCCSPLPPLTANWIIQAKPTASQLQKGGWGLNIELHPVKIQIYRCSALTISGFNVIFILQSSQALCPSSTFRLKTYRARQTNILLSDVKDLTSFTNICRWKRTRALSLERAPSSHSQLLCFVSFYSFISFLFYILFWCSFLFSSFFLIPFFSFFLIPLSLRLFSSSLSIYTFPFSSSYFPPTALTFLSSPSSHFFAFLNFSFTCFYLLLSLFLF